MEFKFSITRDKKPSEAPIEQEVKIVKEQPEFAQEQWEEKFSDVVRRVFMEENERYALMPKEQPETEKPIIGPGRVSTYEGFRSYVPNSNSPVPTNFNFKLLGLIKNLAIWNPHVSMAIENLVTLGNTDYDIKFGNKINSNLASQYKDFLNNRVATWYEFSDGEDSLDNDLLAQLGCYGAISAEAVIRPDMKGIQNIVRVDPEFIRFAYDERTAMHIPLQEIAGVVSKDKTKYPGYIELNKYTYSYIALMRMGEMPYAIPPFLSAIESIFIENDMVKNFQNMMKRLGMMGFLSVLVNAPQIVHGESKDAYQARLTSYLEKLRPGVEKGFSRGIVMGYKDTHEFEVHAPMNPAAAEQAMNMIQSLVFAGVKQDPNMHGKNNSVTETFGRVLLEKMTLQIANKQKALGTFKARIFKLELLLNGIKVPQLLVTYKPAATADEKRKEEIGKLKRDNLRADYQDGLIDQETRAQLLGYDEAAEDEPRISDAMKIADKKIAIDKKKSKASNSIERIKKKLKSDLPVYDYFVPKECGDHSSIDLSKSLEPFKKKYISAVNKQFKKALDESRVDLSTEIKKLQEGATENQFVTAVVFGLLKNWESNFSDPTSDIVEENILPVYSAFREDKKIFTEAEGFSKSQQSFFTIPEAVFNLLDYRAIEFLQNMDKIYLGKFITDPDTQERIVNWLREKFQKGDVPIGKSSTLVAEFINKFYELVELESWKIRRILETTLNRTRNIGNLMYMNQAVVINYEVIEVMDDLTCGWCRHMNGKSFSVTETVEKYKKIFKAGVDKLPDLSPFATSIKIDQFVKLNPKEIQAKGINIPSYHPHCRGRIIAHFKA